MIDGDHSVVYADVEQLCCTPGTDIIKKIKGNDDFL